jgi:hypothetical protein
VSIENQSRRAYDEPLSTCDRFGVLSFITGMMFMLIIDLAMRAVGG